MALMASVKWTVWVLCLHMLYFRKQIMRKVVNLKLGEVVIMPSGEEARVIELRYATVTFVYCHRRGSVELTRRFINRVRLWP